MTKEEAIEFFKEQKEIFGENSLMYKAIDRAIESLEKEHILYSNGYDDGYEEGYCDGYQTGLNEQYEEEED